MMDENNIKQIDDTIRLVKWLSDHPKIQRRLFDSEYRITPHECLEIIELLEENGFYEMILVLLMGNQQNSVLSEALSKLIIDKFVNEWQNIGTGQMCSDLKEKIREEINCRESGDART